MFALIDANNFYASCERVFQPQLKNKPLIVLSNNDGCAIARSNEAKALGIPMGAPLYQLQKLIKQHDIAIRSANFTLYGDMSQRLMSCIEELSPNIEIYSIDEAFVHIGQYHDTRQWAEHLRTKLLQWTGLPCSVGIGRTKVLAKLANKLAKKSGGAFLITPDQEQAILSATPVGDIWGIGKRCASRLNQMSIYTAAQLTATNQSTLRRRFSVVMSRIQDELNGISVLSLEDTPQARQQILVSRSFGETVSDIDSLHQAIIRFIDEGARKLRRQHSQARIIQVALNTNPYASQNKQYHRSAEYRLPIASACTTTLNKYAIALLQQIYKPGYDYKRAGIVLSELSLQQHQQADLFMPQESQALDHVKDTINKRYGRATVMPATLIAKNQKWHMRREHLSKQFTTNWAHLPTVL